MQYNHIIPNFEPIVISGMSGRFPESDTTDELANNMYNNIEIITEDNRRWPTTISGQNHRMGKLKHIDHFDDDFFGGIKQYNCDIIDAESRILLEAAYECIIDAGINPQSMRGSNTAVYIGCTNYGWPGQVQEDLFPDAQNSFGENMFKFQGDTKCFYANRISYILDFKGPSMVLDTACSSGLVAFDHAVKQMMLGTCDRAIVASATICQSPFPNCLYQWFGVNAPDGIPKVWDEKADGYVRGEAVICFLLQRKSDAKRIYATVCNSEVNIDGYKTEGIMSPSSEVQEKLMMEVYKKARVDPTLVSYVEAHATGTSVGDTVEANAIYNSFCRDIIRDRPVYIGLSKSIIGHTESSSGLASLVKLLLSYERECISANRNLNRIKSTIKPFCPPFLPVIENTRYDPGLAVVNNFGIGGVNATLLVEPNYKTTNEDNIKVVDIIPRIVNICCRTEEAFNQMCDWIEGNPQRVSRDFLALLAETMRLEPALNSSGFPFRGSLFIKQLSDKSFGYKRQYSSFNGKSVRPVWFIFAGLGGQWVGMAKALMPIKIFADKIEECHQILKPYDIDLKYLLLSDDKHTMSTMTNKFCATTAFQIALYDVLKSLNITSDGIMGHSFGEISAAYAAGCLTTREALLVTDYRGFVTENDENLPKGLMAVIGLSWDVAEKMCPEGVQVVCNNGKDTVVVSGPEENVRSFIKTLEGKTFVREIDSNNLPYHSRYMAGSAEIMTAKLREVIPKPKLRTNSWISTAIKGSILTEELKYASAEYFAHNLMNPVYFYDQLIKIPKDSIVVEIGPHGLFSRVVTDTITSGNYISLVKKDSNETNLDMFLSSIGKLYELGLNPTIENLYPKIEWPVARGTQSISSLMRWNHSKSLSIKAYPEYTHRANASDMNWLINLDQKISSFIIDHQINEKIIYPASGYLMLAWRKLAAHYNQPWNEISVIFEDVQFRRALFVSESEIIKIKVKYLKETGNFIISEGDDILCCGKIGTTDENCLNFQNLITDTNEKKPQEFEINLNSIDIYKDFRVRGYDYGNKFQKLKTLKTNDFKELYGEVEWDGNWITFIDSLLQTTLMSQPFRKLLIPVMIKLLRCDPRTLNKAIELNRLQTKSVNTDQVDENDMSIENKSEVTEKLINDYKLFESVLPYYVDLETNIVVTPGVEIEVLIAEPIPSNINTRDLKLESYQFIGNHDLNAIEDNERQTVLEYIELCASLARQIDSILSSDRNVKITKKDFEDLRDDQVLLKLFNDIMNGSVEIEYNLVIEKILKYEIQMDSDIINKLAKSERLIRPLIDIVSENIVPKREIRVLEVHSSNDLLAEEVTNYLSFAALHTIDVNYTIAVQSIDAIPEEYKNKSFKLIEWKASDSSVYPSGIMSTDLIVYKDSHHSWPSNLEKQLQEKSDTLVNRGFLLSLFRYQLTEPEIFINKLSCKEIKLEKRVDQYLRAAKNVGLILIGHRSDAIGWVSLLFRKMSTSVKIPRDEDIIKITSITSEWFDSLKIKLIKNTEIDEKNNLWLIADSPTNGIIGLVNCLRLEAGGEALRCLFNCDHSFNSETDITETETFKDILMKDLAINVVKSGQLGTYRHLTLPSNNDKTESDKYFLGITDKKDLSALQWYDLDDSVSQKSYNRLNQRITEIDCDIYMCGINFRDIMLAKGRVSAGAQTMLFESVLGLEFTGRRSDTRERIMGVSIGNGFATHISVAESLITRIPDHWSMEEAVTIPSTYMTVWYGLIERARLMKGETILIHSGTGGVGQAAINVCQYYNCDIFVTVGNNQKKDFLMKTFNIPENRIFSSRNIDFKYEILKLTKGKGVDIVLNSLTGDKMDASIACLATSGRFVEIGKYELQMNKQLGMYSFLKDITFYGVEVDQRMIEGTKMVEDFFCWMHENSTNGMIKPINTIVFNSEEAEKAFRYMTTGKHIGKIVIKIRDEEKQKQLKNNFNSPKKMMVSTKTYFNANKVFIIIGGLGGFGLELIPWMIFYGARNIVLTSRNGVKTEYQNLILKRLKNFGENNRYFESKIIVSKVDTNTIEGSKKLISDSQKLGDIGGVFHLALVLNDRLLENQTIDSFNETIDTKVKTFENLDEISRQMKLNLDYFVVFSSVSCGKGNAGQSNYGYGNSVCERICEARRMDGLHGLAIQWGPIGDVGVLVDNEELNTSITAVKQRINSCLQTLEKLLQSNKSIVSSMIQAEKVTSTATVETKISKNFWQLLGVDPKNIPDQTTLEEIGMNSLFTTDFQQSLDREYGIKLSQKQIKGLSIRMMKDFEGGNIDQLKKYAEK